MRPLLAALKKRADLDDATLDAVASVVRRRLDEEDISEDEWEAAERTSRDEGMVDPDWARASVGETDGEVSLHVRKLHSQGKLNEEIIEEALNSGQKAFVVMAISLLAGVPDTVVRKAAALQNAKVIVALAWKAGISMRMAARLQMQVASIPPSGVLRASDSDDYPLSPDEMNWQLEFVAGMSS